MKPELVSYLKEKARQPFDIRTNNCIQFTNECWKIHHGFYWSEELLSVPSFDVSGFSNPLEGADHYLVRTEKPQEGHLVAIKVLGDTDLQGLATGFCVGDLSVFLNTRGVKYLPTKIVNYSWRNKQSLCSQFNCVKQEQ